MSFPATALEELHEWAASVPGTDVWEDVMDKPDLGKTRVVMLSIRAPRASILVMWQDAGLTWFQICSTSCASVKPSQTSSTPSQLANLLVTAMEMSY